MTDATPEVTNEQVQEAADKMGLQGMAGIHRAAGRKQAEKVKPVWEISVTEALEGTSEQPARTNTFKLRSPIKDKIRQKAKRMAKYEGVTVDGPYRINPFSGERLPTVEVMKTSYNERVAALEAMLKKRQEEQTKAEAEDAARKEKIDAAEARVVESEVISVTPIGSDGPNLGGDKFTNNGPVELGGTVTV